MGVIEFLLSCGISGMLYAMLSGQPMTFIGPTGLTLCFIVALSSFCQKYAIPFLPMYTWVGGWTSLMLLLLSAANACDFIKYCTRFTDEVFNALLSLNFIYEALRNIVASFFRVGADKTQPLLALNMALATLFLSEKMVNYRSSKYFSKRVRTFLADFGPSLTIIIMTAVSSLPMVANLGVTFLKAPKTFELANNRPWLVPFWELPTPWRFAALVPACFLTILFFLDHNISIRVVNSPKMKKGPAYHIDLFVLGLLTLLSSIIGLPWQCAATIQSINHVKSTSDYTAVQAEDGTTREEVVNITETRLTGIGIHALVLASVKLLPLLRKIPVAVISGTFLFLGKKVMQGNTFLERIKGAFSDLTMLPEQSPFKVLGRRRVNLFTTIQLFLLGLLWGLKSNPATGMFFPSVIGVLMATRSFIIPKIFKEEEIAFLDDEEDNVDKK